MLSLKRWLHENPYLALLIIGLVIAALTFLVAKQFVIALVAPLYAIFQSRAETERRITERKAEQQHFAQQLSAARAKAVANTERTKESAAKEVDEWLDR